MFSKTDVRPGAIVFSCAYAALVAALSACGGGGGDSTPPPPTPPSPAPTPAPAPVPAITVQAASSTAVAGGATVEVDATVANATGTPTWGLIGPGQFEILAGGDAVTYTPPATEDLAAPDIATIQATLGSLTRSATIALQPAAGTTWTTALQPQEDLWSVAYGAGTFVAGGRYGFVQTSSDGQHWTARPLDIGVSVRAILWDGAEFVATGGTGFNDDGAVSVSPDGITWTTTVPPAMAADYVQYIVYGNGTYIVSAATYNGAHHFYTSTDRVNWTAQGTHAFPIAFGNGVFIGGYGPAQYSTDGVTWFDGTNAPATVGSISFANGRFLAMTGSGAVTSTDGKTWTNATPFSTTLNGAASNVALGAGGYHVYGIGNTFYSVDEHTIATSSDGANWAIEQTTSSWLGLRGIAAGPSGFVAVGDLDVVETSADARNWTQVVTSPIQDTLVAVGFAKGRYVAVTFDLAATTSTDGVTWSTPQYLPAVPAYNSGRVQEHGNPFLAYGNGVFVVVDGGGFIETSPDGTTWTATQIAPTSPLSVGEINQLTYGNGVFVAIDIYGVAYTSPDGSTWVSNGARLHNATDGALSFGAGRFVVLFSDGSNASSTDGMSWTAGTSFTGPGFGVTYFNGAYGAAGFVAVSDGGFIALSADGSTWTTPSTGLQANFTAITYGAGRYIAATDDGNFYSSADGVTWHKRTTDAFRTTYAMTFGGTGFVAVGDAVVLSAH